MGTARTPTTIASGRPAQSGGHPSGITFSDPKNSGDAATVPIASQTRR